MREEVVRPRLEACDDDAGVVDMLEDAHCNTLKFENFRMLIGKTINQRFSHNLKFSQLLFSLLET
jgi:hypothetical protein